MSEIKITVCDKCMKASCWQGIFYCDEYKQAGVIEVPISKLQEMNLEHSSYWEEEADGE